MSTAKNGLSRQLWYWISLRMIGLALAAMLVVGAGMWLRFFSWETKLRNALPEAVRQELKSVPGLKIQLVGLDAEASALPLPGDTFMVLAVGL